MGNPEYVLLLVNPEEKTLGLVESPNAPGANRIRYAKGKQCQELYSTSLARQFRRVMPNWINGGKYLLTGDLMADGTALFSMETAIHTATGKPKYHD